MTTATTNIQSSLLKVQGAQIYYEVQGTGPVLLMIPGGPTDAGIFAPLAGLLSDRYTVVRYDPRGNSRSVLDGPPEDQRMDLHGDDAAQLLAMLSGCARSLHMNRLAWSCCLKSRSTAPSSKKSRKHTKTKAQVLRCRNSWWAPALQAARQRKGRRRSAGSA